MQEVRARLRDRRAQTTARGLGFEAYADGPYPLPPDAIPSRDLREAVRYVELGYNKVNVEMALTETRLPLVSGPGHRLRSAPHDLVRFYVNRLAVRQMRFIEQTTRALTVLLRDLEAAICDLRARTGEVEANQG
jgi:hypothetical protein